MKHYDQSEEAKATFLKESDMAQVMLTGDPTRVFTREELAAIRGLDDRTIRNEVAELANYYPVLSLSKGKGYRVLSFDENTTIEQLELMLEEAQHQIREFQSRVDNLNARLKPLIALQKEIEKKLGN